jgi:hypothetical protein
MTTIPEQITIEQVREALQVLGLGGIENPRHLSVDVRQLRIVFQPDGYGTNVESVAVIDVVWPKINLTNDPQADTYNGNRESTCDCGHSVFSHDNLGCNRRIGSCDVCPCAVDVNTLTAKITGIEEQ